jgi:hypothetical protein
MTDEPRSVLTWEANDADEPMSILVYGHHDVILVKQVHLNRYIDFTIQIYWAIDVLLSLK